VNSLRLAPLVLLLAQAFAFSAHAAGVCRTADNRAPDFASIAAKVGPAVVSLQNQSSMLSQALAPARSLKGDSGSTAPADWLAPDGRARLNANPAAAGTLISDEGSSPDPIAPDAQAQAVPDGSGAAQDAAPDKQPSPLPHSDANATVVSKGALPQTPDQIQAAITRILAPARAGGQRVAIGSGFLISSDGLILTNEHVVKDAQTLRVTLVDGRQFIARVLGANSKLDIALAKIDATGLKALALGDPDAVRVGDWALAIGAPFGFESSVTSGIISATKRDLAGSRAPFFQTDVPVNPGNSGGPLVNLCGEVIGVNSQIYSRSGGFQGISFAIPIDWALKAAKAIQDGEPFGRSRIGVSMQELTPSLASAFKQPGKKGAIITRVQPNGAAKRAGLKEGDVVLGVDGQALDGSYDFLRRVSSAPPGGHVSLSVIRDGQPLTIDAAVSQPPADEKTEMVMASASADSLGLLARALTPDEAAKTGAKTGLLVNQVSGVASEAGLMSGDAILRVGDQPVSSLATLQSEMAAFGDQPAPVLAWRSGARFFVVLANKASAASLAPSPKSPIAPPSAPSEPS